MAQLRSVLLRVIAPCLALVLLLGGLSEIEVRVEASPNLGEAVAVVEHLRLQVLTGAVKTGWLPNAAAGSLG